MLTLHIFWMLFIILLLIISIQIEIIFYMGMCHFMLLHMKRMSLVFLESNYAVKSVNIIVIGNIVTALNKLCFLHSYEVKLRGAYLDGIDVSLSQGTGYKDNKIS